MTRCPGCPVPEGVPCFAGANGLADWCGDLGRWGNVVLGRSLGVIVDGPGPEAGRLHDLARACPHARGEWRECGCGDRGCRRLEKVVSGLDCLLCVASGGDA